MLTSCKPMRHIRCHLLFLVLLLFTDDLMAQVDLCRWKNVKVNLVTDDDILCDKYAKFNSGEGFGVINIDGDTILPPLYWKIDYFPSGFFVCQTMMGECGLYNERNEVILPIKYDKIKVFKHGVQAIKNNKPTFYDFDGKIKFDSIFSKYIVKQESEDLLVLSNENGNDGIAYSNGQWLISYCNMSFDITNANIITGMKNSKKYILDRLGRQLNNQPFVNLDYFYSFLIGKYTVQDSFQIFTTDGIPFIEISPFIDYKKDKDFLIVRDQSTERVYDRQMQLKFETKRENSFCTHFFDRCDLDQDDTYFSSCVAGKTVLYKNFQTISKSIYNWIELYKGLFLCVKNDGIDILDKDGKLFGTFGPSVAIMPNNSNYCLRSKSDYIDSIYYLDERRYIKIKKCENILIVSNQFFCAQSNGKFNLYNKHGNLILKDINQLISHILTFDCFYDLLTKKDKLGWIYKDKVVLPKYKDVKFLSDDLVLVNINKKWKLLNNDGTTFDNLDYSAMDDCDYGVILNADNDYFYMSKSKKRNLYSMPFSDYKKGNNALAIKFENKWKIYYLVNDTLFQNEFERIDFENNIIKTEIGDYVINCSTSELVSLITQK